MDPKFSISYNPGTEFHGMGSSYRVTTNNDFQVRLGFPCMPYVKNLDTGKDHTINKIWLNTTIELNPGYPDLEQELIACIDETKSVKVHSFADMVIIEFHTPVTIENHHGITSVELMF